MTAKEQIAALTRIVETLLDPRRTCGQSAEAKRQLARLKKAQGR